MSLKKNLSQWGIAIGLSVLCAGVAYAGTKGTAGGEEFSDIWDLIQGWSQGVLGRIIALGALIVGIAYGLVRQSVVAAVVGIAMAVILQYGPDVIEGILTSTDAPAPTVVQTLDNGMASHLPELIALNK